MDKFVCEARVRFQGRDLHMNKIITRIDLHDIIPNRRPAMDPMDLALEHRTSERRRRLVDMIAAEFAHALTEALFAQPDGSR